jgi:hypothetical protein
MRSTGWLRIGISLLLVFALLSCGSDEPTKQEKVTKLLTQNGGRWEASGGANSITMDGEIVPDDFFPSGFSITFTKKTFTTTGNSPIWAASNSPASDSWFFKDKDAEVLIRTSDDREITIVSISSSELILQMEWDQRTDNGRVKSLPGTYQFVMGK